MMEQFKSFQKEKTVKLTPIEKAQIAWGKRKVALLLTKGMKVVKKELKLSKKKVLRKKRVHLPSIRKLISIADKKFSLFIRQRDKSCVLCKSTSNLCNGHLIKRGKKAVRWDEYNCNCLCMSCNYKDNLDHDVYVGWFLRKYDVNTYQNLIHFSRGIFKPSRTFLNDIIKKYETKS